MTTVLVTWRGEVEATKKEGGTKAELEALEAKLKASKDAMSGNARSVMARMSGNNDAAALTLALTTWKQAVDMTKQEREYEKLVKEKEEQMKAQLANKKE